MGMGLLGNWVSFMWLGSGVVGGTCWEELHLEKQGQATHRSLGLPCRQLGPNRGLQPRRDMLMG